MVRLGLLAWDRACRRLALATVTVRTSALSECLATTGLVPAGVTRYLFTFLGWVSGLSSPTSDVEVAVLVTNQGLV